MKHAGTAALDDLRELIIAIQSRGLKERSPGVLCIQRRLPSRLMSAGKRSLLRVEPFISARRYT